MRGGNRGGEGRGQRRGHGKGREYGEKRLGRRDKMKWTRSENPKL